MYISLADSCAKGFRKWADTHQPDDSNDGDDGKSARAVTAASDLDHAVMAPPEQPYRPWLVPGTGRL